ncbi:hypothetical protein ACT453_51455, partial [Bacillus sp. D-CC]
YLIHNPQIKHGKIRVALRILFFAVPGCVFVPLNVNLAPAAKNKMRNATKLAMEFNSYLPVEEAPEYTEGYEGFLHLLHNIFNVMFTR